MPDVQVPVCLGLSRTALLNHTCHISIPSFFSTSPTPLAVRQQLKDTESFSWQFLKERLLDNYQSLPELNKEELEREGKES